MSFVEIGYIAVGFIALYGYWTQLCAIFRLGAMLKSASLKTYSLWSFTSFLTMLYAIFENGDLLFIIVSVCNVFGCLSCALVIAYQRKKNNVPIFITSNRTLNPFVGKK